MNISMKYGSTRIIPAQAGMTVLRKCDTLYGYNPDIYPAARGMIARAAPSEGIIVWT